MILVRFCSINFSYLALNKNATLLFIINYISINYIFFTNVNAVFPHKCKPPGNSEKRMSE
jgi:hypothetical protein